MTTTPNTRRTGLGLVLAATTLAAAASPALAAEQDKTLRVGLPRIMESRGNPYAGNGSPGIYTWSALFDALTVVGGDGTAQPALATAWKNTGPTTWEFTLREAKFHDGEALDADAVVAAVQWLQSDEGAAKGGSMAGRTRAYVASAKALDARRVEITTPKPNPTVPNRASGLWVPAPKAWKELGVGGFSEKPAGTGSYQIVSWDTTTAKMTEFPASWRAPKIKNLEFQGLPEQAARVAAFLSGQVDIVISVPTDSFAQIRAAKGIIEAQPSSTVSTLAITQANAKPGVDVSAVADKRVRLALNYGINSGGMAEGLLASLGGKATGQGVASPVWGYNTAVKPYPYDPAKAKQLLTEAGYGNGLKLCAEVVTGFSPADKEILSQAAQDLRKIGVELELRNVTGAEWFQKFSGITYDCPLWTMSWDGAPEMDAAASFHNQSCDKSPKPYICDTRQQGLLNQINSEFDRSKRLQLIHELIQVQHDEAVNLFLVEYARTDARSPKVQNYKDIHLKVNYHEMTLSD